MMRVIRGIVVAIGLFFLLLGMLFILGTPRFPDVWLNSYVIGTTFVAYAISALWIGITQSYKALVGAGLCAAVTFGGIGLYLLRLSLQTTGLVRAGEFCLYIAILAVWFLFLGLRVVKRKTDRLPITTQWLFAVSLTFALLEGLYLVVPLPGHFPWILNPEISVLFGWILIGGALFFGWSLVLPIWENAYPLLYTLLVYAAFLIGPYLSLLKQPDQVAVIPFYLWLGIIFVLGSGIWALLELIGRFFTVRKS